MTEALAKVIRDQLRLVAEAAAVDRSRISEIVRDRRSGREAADG